MINQTKQGDLSVPRNLAVGGTSVVQGRQIVEGDLRVKGVLLANDTVSPFKGLFATEDELREVCGSPEKGDYALVVAGNDTSRVWLWVEKNGSWKNSMCMYDNPFPTEVMNEIDALRARIEAALTKLMNEESAFITALADKVDKADIIDTWPAEDEVSDDTVLSSQVVFDELNATYHSFDERLENMGRDLGQCVDRLEDVEENSASHAEQIEYLARYTSQIDGTVSGNFDTIQLHERRLMDVEASLKRMPLIDERIDDVEKHVSDTVEYGSRITEVEVQTEYQATLIGRNDEAIRELRELAEDTAGKVKGYDEVIERLDSVDEAIERHNSGLDHHGDLIGELQESKLDKSKVIGWSDEFSEDTVYSSFTVNQVIEDVNTTLSEHHDDINSNGVRISSLQKAVDELELSVGHCEESIGYIETLDIAPLKTWKESADSMLQRHESDIDTLEQNKLDKSAIIDEWPAAQDVSSDTVISSAVVLEEITARDMSLIYSIAELTTTKAQTWYQEENPISEWDRDKQLEHTGDLWYNPQTKLLQRFAYGVPRPGAMPGGYWRTVATNIETGEYIDERAVAHRFTAQTANGGKYAVHIGYPRLEVYNGSSSDGFYPVLRPRYSENIPTQLVEPNKEIGLSQLTDMSGMFACLPPKEMPEELIAMLGKAPIASDPITSIDLSQLNTTGVTNMEGMFMYYGGTELDLSSFDVSSVTRLGLFAFGSETLETINFSGWQLDVSKVEGTLDEVAFGFYPATWIHPVTFIMRGCNPEFIAMAQQLKENIGDNLTIITD